MSFINKVVLITGSGSGLGAGMALHFAKLDASLCLVDKNADNLTKVSEQIKKVSESKVLEVVADVSKDEDVKNIVQSALKEYNKIDVLINCAGIHGVGNVKDSDILEKYDRIMAVNLRSVIALTSLATPALIKSKGCVINIASISGITTQADTLPYNLSKSGLIHFTKCTALDLANDGVRVNSISPGPVKSNILINSLTPVSESKQEAYWNAMGQSMPLKRVGYPEDIAEMAAFLASDKASCITGSDFVVDCGLLLGANDGVPGIPEK